MSVKRPPDTLVSDAKRSRTSADWSSLQKEIWTLTLRDFGRSNLLGFRATCRRFRAIADELVNTCWEKLKVNPPPGPIDLRSLAGYYEKKYAGRMTLVSFQAFRRMFGVMEVGLQGNDVPLTPEDFSRLQVLTEAVNDQALCILYKRLPPRLALPQADTEAVKKWMSDPSQSEVLGNIDYMNCNHENAETLYILPSVIGQMTSLQALYLQENQLQLLPTQFVNLRSLAILSLTQNRLRFFPMQIASLSNLRTLHLSENAITTLPKELASLAGLEELTLDGNPLMFIPDEVLSSDIAGIKECEAILNFKEEWKYIPQHRLAILYHAIIQRKSREEIMPLFLRLSSRDKQVIAQNLKLFAARKQTKNEQWGQDHVFDDMFYFCCAVRAAIEFKLTQVPKHRVYTHACLLQGRDTLKCYHSDVLDNIPSIADAIAVIEKENQEAQVLKTLWKAFREQLPHLPSLDSADEIQAWLSDLGNAPALDQIQSLNLSHKGLQSLPKEIRVLRRLETLDLSHNAFTSIPPSIHLLYSLQTLQFDGNPLLAVEDEILYSMRDCFARCLAVYRFRAERRYAAQSPLARLYQSKNGAFFDSLDSKDKMLILERWWHVDNFHLAVREAILTKLDRLSFGQKERVYNNVCLLEDGGPITQWGRHHARDNLPLLADAMCFIE